MQDSGLTKVSRLGHEDTAGAGPDDGVLPGQVDLWPLIIVASEHTARVVRPSREWKTVPAGFSIVPGGEGGGGGLWKYRILLITSVGWKLKLL